MSDKAKWLGDVQTAFERLDAVSPRMAEAKINNSDQNPHRYGVTLWNLFGKWYASEPTLAASIHAAIDKAEAVGWNFELATAARSTGTDTPTEGEAHE